MAEAEALRAKLEREKQELRDFLEQGNEFLDFTYHDEGALNLLFNSLSIILIYHDR